MPSPGGLFRIIWSEEKHEEASALADLAIERGLARDFLRDIKEIQQNLAIEPLTWGDPWFTLKSAGLVMCHGIQGMLQIYYGVDEERRLVYVKELVPAPGRGLE
jgi:hypothetical protein